MSLYFKLQKLQKLHVLLETTFMIICKASLRTPTLHITLNTTNFVIKQAKKVKILKSLPLKDYVTMDLATYFTWIVVADLFIRHGFSK